MLALSRQLPEAQRGLREGRWAQPVGQALLGKTACVVGLGSIGLALAGRLHSFRMRLSATRKSFDKGAPGYVRLYRQAQLAEALSDADYVILCVRAGDENKRLFDARMLAAMKPGAILVNVARGSLVDEDALLASLDSGHLRGAGLDVFCKEPADPRHPLVQSPRVIATPHIAGVTDVNLARMFELLVENLRRYGRGETPHYLVNQPATSRSSRVHN